MEHDEFDEMVGRLAAANNRISELESENDRLSRENDELTSDAEKLNDENRLLRKGLAQVQALCEGLFSELRDL